MDASRIVTASTEALGLVDIHCRIDPVHAQDWEASIRESYRPIQITPSLCIVPTWADVPHASPPHTSKFATSPVNQTNIILEPGLAFGTGDHPTTRLCLKWLSELPDRGHLVEEDVMDYGTGSGVLAVAACLLGARRAVGTDVEALAVKAAMQNATANGVQDKVQMLRCSGDAGVDSEPLRAHGFAKEDCVFDV
jgi:ribosomal protein L11 methyltransferase